MTINDLLKSYWPIYSPAQKWEIFVKKIGGKQDSYIVWSDARMKIKREKYILDIWYYDGDENEFVVFWTLLPLKLLLCMSHFYWDTLYSFSSSCSARKKCNFNVGFPTFSFLFYNDNLTNNSQFYVLLSVKH